MLRIKFAAMTSDQMHVSGIPKQSAQIGERSAGDHCDMSIRKSRESLQGTERIRIGMGLRGIGNDRRQRAIVVARQEKIG
jgi:hypothetical protein